jgi:hypothetical protein
MISFSLEPQVDNALFKTNAKNAKDSAQITDKCNDPAASWLRPAEELGMKRISHFWVENCAVRYAKAGRPLVRFGSKADIALHQRMSAMGQTDITVVTACRPLPCQSPCLQHHSLEPHVTPPTARGLHGNAQRVFVEGFQSERRWIRWHQCNSLTAPAKNRSSHQQIGERRLWPE